MNDVSEIRVATVTTEEHENVFPDTAAVCVRLFHQKSFYKREQKCGPFSLLRPPWSFQCFIIVLVRSQRPNSNIITVMFY